MFTRLKNMVMKTSREKKINHFYSLCSGNEKILDVGVSSENKSGVEARNLFLKTFRFLPSQYTGLGIEDMTGMSEKFPGKKFVQFGGDIFPFKNEEFDIVFSNAVIEHVGCEKKQIVFVSEMLRVGKVVYFTTPNKFFPIETHTLVPILHWFNAPFYKWCRLYRPYFTPDTLNLLTKSRIEKILKKSNCSDYQITANKFMGLTMTYTVICKRHRSGH